MVLFNDIFEVFDLPDDNGNVIILDDLINSCFICTTLVRRYFFRHIIAINGLLEKAHGGCFITLGCQYEINGWF